MKKMLFVVLLLAFVAALEKPEDHGWQTGGGAALLTADAGAVAAYDHQNALVCAPEHRPGMTAEPGR